MTSKWVRQVAALRALDVEWRFISLRLINAAVDYGTHFPPGYERSHSAGLELLRVAAAVRRERGPGAVGPLYAAYGSEIFDTEPGRQAGLHRDPEAFAAPILSRLGLSTGLAGAVSDRAFDAEIQAETDAGFRAVVRSVHTAGSSTDGHGPGPENGLRTWSICRFRRSSRPWMQWL
jgi:Mycothiol-dependent nitroreductase Rv2466c